MSLCQSEYSVRFYTAICGFRPIIFRHNRCNSQELTIQYMQGGPLCVEPVPIHAVSRSLDGDALIELLTDSAEPCEQPKAISAAMHSPCAVQHRNPQSCLRSLPVAGECCLASGLGRHAVLAHASCAPAAVHTCPRVLSYPRLPCCKGYSAAALFSVESSQAHRLLHLLLHRECHRNLYRGF